MSVPYAVVCVSLLIMWISLMLHGIFLQTTLYKQDDCHTALSDFQRRSHGRRSAVLLDALLLNDLSIDD